MEYPGDQTKIHLNPDFISTRVKTVNPKVHVNPAFLLKSQGIQQEQKYASAASPIIGGTVHGQHWRGTSATATNAAARPMTAGLPNTYHRNTDKQVYPPSSKIVNTTTLSSDPKTQNIFTKQVYPASSEIVNNATLSSNPKTQSIFTKQVYHPSLRNVNNSTLLSKPKSQNIYKKNNVIDPYKTNVSIQKGAVQSQHFVSENANWGKHTSAYSWKAANTKVWVSSHNSVASVKNNGNHSGVKTSGNTTQQLVQPNSVYESAVTKSHPIPSVKSITASQGDFQQSVKRLSIPHSSHSHALDVRKKTNVTVINQATVCEKDMTSTTLDVNKAGNENIAIEKPDRVLGSTLKREELKTPGKEASNSFSVPLVQIPKSSGSHRNVKSVQFSPNRKWSSPNKLVNVSSKKTMQTKVIESKRNISSVTSKMNRTREDYKIISKTKLVRTQSCNTTKCRAQERAVVKRQPGGYVLKRTPHTSHRPLQLSKIQKFSPATKLHPTVSKHSSKRRYSVLSHTKLIRSQSNKVGLPGKPKYTVNTKNKLIRRRSDSGNGGCKSLGKTNESRLTGTKPEMERQRKFHILSKTKIVRRKSNPGMHKTGTTKSPVTLNATHPKKRAIVRRHKLVRNASSAPGRHEINKFTRKSYTKNVNTAFKVINTGWKLSAKQKLAKGMISKYKINRLKVESFDPRKYPRFLEYSLKSRRKNKFKFEKKKVNATKRSDRFINIGGILYKSTMMSLRKQLPKANYKTGVKNPYSTCTVLLRGEKFHVTADGKTLQRVKDSSHPSHFKSSLPRVHIGGLTFSRTRTGQYELTKTHQARALLSSARQRSMVTLIQKRKKASYQKRNEYCIFFNRFGRCSRKNRGECPYVHDPRRVAICTRFLRGRCPVKNCPFSHTIDPDKMPVCSHFVQSACTREDCPYRHVKVNPAAPVCLDFVRGHCKAGEECTKQHILVCEEFRTTSKCSRGKSCPLSHHKGKNRPRRVSSGDNNRRHSISKYRKRKISESLEILGGPVVKKRGEKKRNIEGISLKKRYFHHVTEESDSITDSQNFHECNPSITDKEKCLEKVCTCNQDEVTYNMNSTSSKSTTNQSTEVQEDDKVQKIQTFENHTGEPTSVSAFEETRYRIMKKVDQMKKSYMVPTYSEPIENTSDSSGNAGDEQNTSGVSHKQNNRKESKKFEDIIKENKSGATGKSPCCECDCNCRSSDLSRVQRPPLPRRLPSYIPLTMEED